ncbi:calcium-binding protein, partial [Pseudomonas synxantha]
MASLNVSSNQTEGVNLSQARSILHAEGAAAMYTYMASHGYKYANLARGVVLNEGLAGQAGNNHLNSVIEESGVQVNVQDIFTTMAEGYLDVLEQRGLEQGDITGKESWVLHSNTLEHYGLPSETWIMNTPFSLLDDASREQLWSESLDAAGTPWKEAILSFKVESFMANASEVLVGPDEQFIYDLAKNLSGATGELSPEQRASALAWAERNGWSTQNLGNMIEALGDGVTDFFNSIKEGLTTNGLFDFLNFAFPSGRGEGGTGGGSGAWGNFLTTLSSLWGFALNMLSPLVLDLDGDGVETLSINSGVKFDHDKDGIAERTGWVAPDDGLLVYDRNLNGNIDDGGELFGNYSERTNGQAAGNGFIALADYDENGDGVINVADSIYSKLQVWKDLDSDGKVSTGEIFGLQELGVTSLSTSYDESRYTDANANGFFQQGSFQSASGEAGSLVDVWFAAENKSINLDFHSLGKLPSLSDAINQDESGKLAALIELFSTERDGVKARTLIDDIVFLWSGVVDSAPNSRGAYLDDARKLMAIEVVLGEGFVQAGNIGLSNPGPNASAKVIKAYEALAEFIYAGLSIKTRYSSWVSSAEVRFDGGEIKFDVDSLVLAMKGVYQRSAEEAIAVYTDFGHVLSVLGERWASKFIDAIRAKGDSSGSGVEFFLANFGSFFGDSLGGEIFGSYLDETIFGLGGDDKIYGGGGNDLIEGGSGNDFLSGDAGNDIYKFGRDWGADTVSNNDGGVGRVDVIEFKSDVFSFDIELFHVGNDLLIKNRSNADQVKVSNFFYDQIFEIQEIRFADGTVWGLEQIKSQVMVSTDGADEIHGYATADTISGGAGADKLFGEKGDDTLIGGVGNDTLDGGSGSDTYLFNLGDGRDIINDDTAFYSGNVDVLRFGAGIGVGDISVT